MYEEKNNEKVTESYEIRNNKASESDGNLDEMTKPRKENYSREPIDKKEDK